MRITMEGNERHMDSWYMPTWSVIETYFGKFETSHEFALCSNFQDARTIVDSMLNYHKGRPFGYKIIYNSENMKIYDSEINFETLDGEKYNFSDYMNYKYCL